MKYICKYALAKFMPFVETGEFANIGIIAFCPEEKFFDFKLMAQAGKLNAFFKPLDSKIYKNAKKDLEQTLLTFKELIQREMSSDLGKANLYFDELVRPREVLIRFDIPRTTLTNNSADKLTELFNFYVGKEFATPAYGEALLEKQLGAILNEKKLKSKYREIDVQGGVHKARFPFAHQNIDGKVIKAIKPLHLSHQDHTRAYRHGWEWVGKMMELEKHGALPEAVLIAAQGPESTNLEGIEVFEGLKQNFIDIGVNFLDASNTRAISEFAALD